jgi:hypothetical protein
MKNSNMFSLNHQKTYNFYTFDACFHKWHTWAYTYIHSLWTLWHSVQLTPSEKTYWKAATWKTSKKMDTVTVALCSIIDFEDRHYVFWVSLYKGVKSLAPHLTAKTSRYFLKWKCGNPTCGWMGDNESHTCQPSLHDRSTDELPTFSPPIRHIIALSPSTAPNVQSATLALLKSTYMYLDKCGSQLRAKAKFTLTSWPVKFAKDLLICIRELNKICTQYRKISSWPRCPRFVISRLI